MPNRDERPTWLRRAPGAQPRISFGADYNPDQWPREVWDEDVALMREANVDVVSVAIFSWARIQPARDRWDLDWLDEVMDLMAANGIGVDLATATASPPPWLTAAHPEVLPVTRDGSVLSQGGRQHWRPTSPVFRRFALELVEVLAERYRSHPALVAWHVSNELGCHNILDFSDDAAAAFRTWLEQRYGTIEQLNEAWGTSFWSQRYGAFAEILPPRLAASFPNPTQQLDFARFSSNALKDHLIAEREILTRITPDVPVTTNFMIMGEMKGMNYADWADAVDFVSNDHYVQPGSGARDELAFSASLTSGVAGHRPWFLMEHSTSAVNWQPINVAKRPGEMARDALAHVARGADAVCYFQWRQSRAGAEKYHSGMVPHAGADSRLFRDVVDLGRMLRQLDEVAGSEPTAAPVGIVFDWESWWASELDSHPTDRLRYRREALEWWRALLDLGIRAEVVPFGGDLSRHRVIVAPILHLVSDRGAARLEDYVREGGHLVLTYFSGIVDERDQIRLGGYPGAFRELLGVRVEEFEPLLDGERLLLDGGLAGDTWSEQVSLTAEDVEVLLSYREAGRNSGPAVTRRAVGAGSASYVSTRLGEEGLRGLLPVLLDAAGLASELPEALRGRVEHAQRADADTVWEFFVNRTDQPVALEGLAGIPILSSGSDDPDVLAARGVAVRRRPRDRAAELDAAD
ncbi:beta-galactosidase [Homoserinibacter sp. YIM 151385]|uniref:beta-galactosidase n=1 Tax=Homoserinibacter sp. YIM 151385 TaxID=2985506 RepID=UPI0022F13D48|nr:beta-galactosidase [Homoserinibacter sp. YIM 151385]WBU37536.1 beta-galactosidase [Homoserinibacter sp. YIM 151385]